MFTRKSPFCGFSECQNRIIEDALSTYSNRLYDKISEIEEIPTFPTDAVLQAEYDECMAKMRIADSLLSEVLKTLTI